MKECFRNALERRAFMITRDVTVYILARSKTLCAISYIRR
jgi:hypothetical protein